MSNFEGFLLLLDTNSGKHMKHIIKIAIVHKHGIRWTFVEWNWRLKYSWGKKWMFCKQMVNQNRLKPKGKLFRVLCCVFATKTDNDSYKWPLSIVVSNDYLRGSSMCGSPFRNGRDLVVQVWSPYLYNRERYRPRHGLSWHQGNTAFWSLRNNFTCFILKEQTKMCLCGAYCVVCKLLATILSCVLYKYLM